MNIRAETISMLDSVVLSEFSHAKKKLGRSIEEREKKSTTVKNSGIWNIYSEG